MIVTVNEDDFLPKADADASLETIPPPDSTFSKAPDGELYPPAAKALRDTGLSDALVEALILRYIFSSGAASGREISGQLGITFGVVEEELMRLKNEMLIGIRRNAPLSDFIYELSRTGLERARRLCAESSYIGTAPVPLEMYIKGVEAQSVRYQHPKLDDLRKSLADLVVDEQMLIRIGEATAAGLGFFLSGEPGNGKTSIAERINCSYGKAIWIPRAVNVGAEIIRLFDPGNHDAMPLDEDNELVSERRVDGRWVRIRRPTVIAGGELTLDQLEVTKNDATGVIEAPLQMKSNCGTLVIDDFGRQRVTPSELLDRWIVPLEKRHDYLNMPSGRQICVPFDQLVVFSTNLDPQDLVDEAFLRRIPYKIVLEDPTEEQFRRVMRIEAGRMGLECSEPAVDYLLQTHYRPIERKMRFCHCKDLLKQVKNSCRFRDLPEVVTSDLLDAAVENYFSCTGG